MKILYVAPRFHTNQVPIVSNLKKNKNSVYFLVQYIGDTEDHSDIKPNKMKMGFLSKVLFRYLGTKYDATKMEGLKTNLFIPSIFFLIKYLINVKPNLIILRERNIASLFVYWISKILNSKCSHIVYNQSSLKVNSASEFRITSLKNNIKDFFIKKVFPHNRITPVKFNDYFDYHLNKENYIVQKNSHYVPFVLDTQNVSKQLDNDYLNILSVGKYRDYKNHFLLIKAITNIKNKKNIRVTIVGQAKSETELKYYEKLNEYILKEGLDNIISLKRNIKFSEMKQYYTSNEVFVLSSKKETASIALLEAMSYGLIPISTHLNGTAAYIDNKKNGLIFESLNDRSLSDQIEYLLNNKKNIVKMSKNAIQSINNECSFDNYVAGINKVLNNSSNRIKKL